VVETNCCAAIARWHQLGMQRDLTTHQPDKFTLSLTMSYLIYMMASMQDLFPLLVSFPRKQIILILLNKV
jgi:hypothetical protein